METFFIYQSNFPLFSETRAVFEEIGSYWQERNRAPALIISLAKGVEASLEPSPHVVTPSLMIHEASQHFPPSLCTALPTKLPTPFHALVFTPWCMNAFGSGFRFKFRFQTNPTPKSRAAPDASTLCGFLFVPAGVPLDNILYLGGPNIAAEIWNKEYANARICGSEQWRKPLAHFLRQPHFVVWDNSDLVTHEVMGGLKNVYAIGAGLVAGLTQDSATSRAVYFAHSASEMIFITHLLAEEPEALAGPLLADAYVTLLKGRNSWYGEQLATGKLTPAMGDNVPGKGTIQVMPGGGGWWGQDIVFPESRFLVFFNSFLFLLLLLLLHINSNGASF